MADYTSIDYSSLIVNLIKDNYSYFNKINKGLLDGILKEQSNGVVIIYQEDTTTVGAKLKEYYAARQEKINNQPDILKCNVASNPQMLRIIARAIHDHLDSAEDFLDQAFDMLGGDYSADFIDYLYKNYGYVYVDQETNTVNGAIVENINTKSISFNITNATYSKCAKKLKEIYENRGKKLESLGDSNRLFTSNELFLRLVVQAIKDSEGNRDKFNTNIIQSLNPDYSQKIIDYIYTEFNFLIKYDSNGKLIGELIKENLDTGNLEITDNDILEWLKLRQQKLNDNKTSRKYITNDMFTSYILQALHRSYNKPNQAAFFRETILDLMDPDYSLEFINYVYENYSYIVEFNDKQELCGEIYLENNLIYVDNNHLNELLKLRQSKLNNMSEEEKKGIMNNRTFLELIIYSLDIAYTHRENFRAVILELMQSYSNNNEVIIQGDDSTQRLYPPLLEGTLPAFANNQLVIPYAMNPATVYDEIIGFSIKIKSIQTNKLIFEGQTKEYDKENNILYLSISDYEKQPFKIGAFYKVQIAYLSKKEIVGYFSTVGIIKCTATPEVYIDGMQEDELHANQQVYVGVYNQSKGDPTDKIYSYNFTIYKEDGSVFETSGELLHNHEDNDDYYKAENQYTIKKTLEPNNIYSIVYTTTSMNGLVTSSHKYRIIQQSTIPPELSADLIVAMNEENGYINIAIEGHLDEKGAEKVGTGTFVISRSSSEDNFGSWQELHRFALYGERPSNRSWKDFTIQHGFSYKYALQQYNQQYQIYSERMVSNVVEAKFEHSFLYDGEKQLKIKYNPKVTSFKDTILEQKTNTIGGKYPFFFRNGNVRYKEFPISGLISYQMDEEELFLTNKEMFLENLDDITRQSTLRPDIQSNDYDYFNNLAEAHIAYGLQGQYALRERTSSQEHKISQQKIRTSNLVDYNFVAERIFKMKVLEFLNDGKPKLFKSPGEGNYIVRLMNSSLSPDDKTSRMLHTFSTTATEIDDLNYDKLNKYNLISIDEPKIKQLRWKTIIIKDYIEDLMKGTTDNIMSDKQYSIGYENNIYSIQCLDMIPGDYIYITWADRTTPQSIQIGATGAYYAEFDIPPKKVEVSKLTKQGQITFSYYGTNLHHFDTYRAIKMNDIPLLQLRNSIKYRLEKNGRKSKYYDYVGTEGQDIRQYFKLEDIKQKITKYYFLNFTKIILSDEEKEHPYNRTEKYEYKFWIDGQEFDITHMNDYQLVLPDHIPEIILGNCICLDISIQRREIEYDVETKYKSVSRARDRYETAYDRVLSTITNPSIIYDYETILADNKELMYQSYQEYIDEIAWALNEEEVYIK